MPIGDYQSLMLPTLKTLADGAEVPLGEIRERIAVSTPRKPSNLRRGTTRLRRVVSPCIGVASVLNRRVRAILPSLGLARLRSSFQR